MLFGKCWNNGTCMVLSQFTGIASQPLADDSSGHAHCRPISACSLSTRVASRSLCTVVTVSICEVWCQPTIQKSAVFARATAGRATKLLNVTKTWALSPFCRTMCVSRRHGNVSPSPERPDNKIRHPENIKTHTFHKEL